MDVLRKGNTNTNTNHFFFCHQTLATFRGTLEDIWSYMNPPSRPAGKGWEHIFIGRYLITVAYQTQ